MTKNPMSVLAKLAVLKVSAVTLIVLSLVVLLGHAMDYKGLTAMGTDTPMSPLTAGAFILIGVSKFVLASILDHKQCCK